MPNLAYSPPGRLLRKRRDSVFERDYVSTSTRETDVRPLVLKGHPNKPYRQHRLSSMYQILASRSEGRFSARWYSFCTELHNVKIHDEVCQKRPRHSYSDAGLIMRAYEQNLLIYLRDIYYQVSFQY